MFIKTGFDCYGILKDRRYGSLDSQYFDGIHLNRDLGKDHYTGGVLKIFKLAFPHLQKVTPYTKQGSNKANSSQGKSSTWELNKSKRYVPFPQNRIHKINPWIQNQTSIPVHNRFNALSSY